MAAELQADITIIGAGLVGKALASALRQTPYHVVILDASAPSRAAGATTDHRSTALAQSSALILNRIGALPLLAGRYQPIDEIQISEQGQFGLMRLQAQAEKVDALGYVLENQALERAFDTLLADAPNVQIRAPATVTAITPNENTVNVQFQQKKPFDLNTRLLIAADGARSFTRRALGIDTVEEDYGLTAISADVSTQKPHQNIAYERFLRTGPLAFLPLQSNRKQTRMSVVWTVHTEMASHLLGVDEKAFLDQLQRQFGYRLGRLHTAANRHAYPAPLITAKHCAGQRALLIGNAAQTLNPVAGQGFNLALRDIATLARLLVQQQSEDPGSATLIDSYCQHRRRDRKQTINFTDRLIKLFCSDLPLPRASGLIAADMLPPLRHHIAAQGMGFLNAMDIEQNHYKQRALG